MNKPKLEMEGRKMVAKSKTSPRRQSKSKITKDKESGLTAPLYTKSGSHRGSVSLPKEIFGQKPNRTLIAQAVRVFLARRRRAHAKTKSRGEVKASTRKIYRQKGTGGARHGPRSAPLFVGGGRAHGPKGIENYHIKLPKRMARASLSVALSGKLVDKRVFVAEIESIEPKTSRVSRLLSKITGDKKQKGVLIVHTGSPALFRAARNIEGVFLVRADQLNTYNTVAANTLVLTKQAVEELGKKR